MASKIKVIGVYRPRIAQGNTVQKPEFIRAASRATGLVEGTVDQGIKEMRDQIIEFMRSGRAVKVEGLGTWTPNIALDGTLDVQYRADTALTNAINVPGTFTGTVLNRENIGKTPEELIEQWNQEHPEDPVTFSEN
ncbi:MAG TPA: hypothetical protein VJ785_16455 [Anaerolineales bacterium]|nr:hypothetical protein [Anaerolineales bacterium]